MVMIKMDLITLIYIKILEQNIIQRDTTLITVGEALIIMDMLKERIPNMIQRDLMYLAMIKMVMINTDMTKKDLM